MDRLMKRAFTLIELLVVIAIIAILAAILFPVFAQAKESAKQTSCLAQVKQFATGIALYAQDADDMAPTLCPNEAAINGGGSATRPWDTQVSPYVKSNQMFQCPSDSNTAPPWWTSYKDYFWDGSFTNNKRKRSYGLVGNLVTAQAVAAGGSGAVDHNTGLNEYDGVHLSAAHPTPTPRSFTSFDEPANTVDILENWTNADQSADSWLGEWYGSVFIDCDARELPGRKYPAAGPSDKLPDGCTADFAPAKGHTSGTIYGFTDGHVKLMNWGQVRANDFRVFKAQKPSTTYTP